MKKTLTQMMIEAVISKSTLYQELKRQCDINIECINELNSAVTELTDAVQLLNHKVHQHDQIIDDLLLSFGSEQDIERFSDIKKEPNKDKLN